MLQMVASKITLNPIHLGLGATAEIQPDFTGAMDWYMDYAARIEDDGAEGRLVSMHTFSESWDMWEMHPNGSEVVLCTSGSVALIQELPDGSENRIVLEEGEYAINAPGVWHTADVVEKASVVFITAGMGTMHRAR